MTEPPLCYVFKTDSGAALEAITASFGDNKLGLLEEFNALLLQDCLP
jgi:hypothetical protein